MMQTRAGATLWREVSRYFLHAVLILFGFALAPQVAAHDGATGVVKERMKMMSALGKTMKSLKAVIRNTDADTVSRRKLW